MQQVIKKGLPEEASDPEEHSENKESESRSHEMMAPLLPSKSSISVLGPLKTGLPALEQSQAQELTKKRPRLGNILFF